MPSFEILIVGAGIVGLAASIGLANKGHKVTVSPDEIHKTLTIKNHTDAMSKVIEATSVLQVVGDGIAVAAISQRVLKYYGILDNFYQGATRNIGVMQHRRYSTGEIVSARDRTTQEQQYGYA
jgi:salicylate hydroxylase